METDPLYNPVGVVQITVSSYQGFATLIPSLWHVSPSEIIERIIVLFERIIVLFERVIGLFEWVIGLFEWVTRLFERVIESSPKGIHVKAKG
jgi:hypothetical protein